MNNNLLQENELERILLEIDESVGRAHDEDWDPPTNDTLERAKQLVSKMYGVHPHPYWIYPCPWSELVIDGGFQSKRVVISLYPGGSVIYTYKDKVTGNTLAVECDNSDLLPDENMINVLKEID